MDVIAGRKTVGRVTGDIMVNGAPKHQSSWARQVGYVEQVRTAGAVCPLGLSACLLGGLWCELWFDKSLFEPSCVY